MFLSVLSAILFYLSFPNLIFKHGLWACIWIFAVPLLHAFEKKPLKERLVRGAVFGFLAYGLMAQGLINISLAGYSLFIIGLGSQSILFSFIYKNSNMSIAKSGLNKQWMYVAYVVIAWCLTEIIRNYLMGGFSFYISHALAFYPQFLGAYGLIGCTGMSGVIILVNCFIYMSLVIPEKRWGYLIIVGFILACVILTSLFKFTQGQHGRHWRVAVVQANILPLEKMDLTLFEQNATLHIYLTKLAYQRYHPDLIIWPETAYPDDLLQNREWLNRIKDQVKAMQTPLLLGIAPNINGHDYNSAVLFNAKGELAGLYHKQALVPFAETTINGPWGMHWGRGYNFYAGDKPGIMVIGHDAVRAGIVICSESAHPDLVRDLIRLKANFIIELSNDGWFSDEASYMLHAQAAVMRAVENQCWVIRSANTGLSFAVDPKGRIHTDQNIKLRQKGVGIFDIMI